MFKAIVAGALALAGMGGSAFAADANWTSPAHNWTGFYIGAFAGAASGSLTPSSGTNSGPSGADVGVTVSYAWQTPSNWVFTPFVAVPLAGQSGTFGGSIPAHIDWAALAGLRLGYAMDRWQPYGFVAGVVGGGTGGTGGGAQHNTHSGIAFGVGIEYALTDRWAFGLRYAHVSVDQKPYFSVPVGWQADSIAATVNFKLN
jgi:outer membrane immunogenic protein